MGASQKKNYIDAIRGWAILMVITSHVGVAFANLPWPVKKLTNFGWHGVQLFFLASAVTLLMSWNSKNGRNADSLTSFFMRRFLRIAPMYYSGALIYIIFEPPAHGFDPAQLLRCFTFVNAWSPDWIPTKPGWAVVPGGWSIGVEFTFYAIFPVIATFITTLSRAGVLFAGSIVLACLCNQVAAELMNYPQPALKNFLYFWFPNQFPIFCLGAVLYQCLTKNVAVVWSRRLTYALTGAAVCVAAAVAERSGGAGIFLPLDPAPPLLQATLCFMVFIYTLAHGPETLISHPYICKVGRLSFSAYVLHFLFVQALPRLMGSLINLHVQGVQAVGECALLLILTIACTMLAASVAHILVEEPGMDLARKLTKKPALSQSLTT